MTGVVQREAGVNEAPVSSASSLSSPHSPQRSLRRPFNGVDMSALA